ncbi:MAG: hypothetical protein QGD96_11300 [Anaerolineae bacterium]|nr:hypothetical protein [Anaerolineae bacterium]
MQPNPGAGVECPGLHQPSQVPDAAISAQQEPVYLLIGSGLMADDFNDDSLGRSSDCRYEARSIGFCATKSLPCLGGSEPILLVFYQDISITHKLKLSLLRRLFATEW